MSMSEYPDQPDILRHIAGADPSFVNQWFAEELVHFDETLNDTLPTLLHYYDVMKGTDIDGYLDAATVCDPVLFPHYKSPTPTQLALSRLRGVQEAGDTGLKGAVVDRFMDPRAIGLRQDAVVGATRRAITDVKVEMDVFPLIFAEARVAIDAIGDIAFTGRPLRRMLLDLESQRRGNKAIAMRVSAALPYVRMFSGIKKHRLQGDK